MVSYDFESFVFGVNATRDPEKLAHVFLKKAQHGGVVRVGEKVYNVRSVTGGLYSGTRVSLSNPHTPATRTLKAEEGLLLSGGDIISEDVKIVTSCSECFSKNITAISDTEIQCSKCEELL